VLYRILKYFKSIENKVKTMFLKKDRTFF